MRGRTSCFSYAHRDKRTAIVGVRVRVRVSVKVQARGAIPAGTDRISLELRFIPKSMRFSYALH